MRALVLMGHLAFELLQVLEECSGKAQAASQLAKRANQIRNKRFVQAFKVSFVYENQGKTSQEGHTFD